MSHDPLWAYKQHNGDRLTRTLPDSIFSATYQEHPMSKSLLPQTPKPHRTPLQRHGSGDSIPSLGRTDSGQSQSSQHAKPLHMQPIACADCQKQNRTRQIALRGYVSPAKLAQPLITGSSQAFSDAFIPQRDQHIPHPLEAYAEQTVLYDLSNKRGLSKKEINLLEGVLKGTAEEMAFFEREGCKRTSPILLLYPSSVAC